ncbi:MarR family transcriptional regulator (plasmid) [Salipiger sp. H15]|uniref:MarR family transcriptional regulator n=1 Tax=Alloyangia sp. H15 TaxID=3029062 RepID=A0AAU8AQY0_9RHOB
MNTPVDKPKDFKKNWPFFWVSQVAAAYEIALERRIKPLGLDIPRWRALMSLYEEEYLSVSQIAEFSALKLNTTTKVIQRMIGDDLVTTRPRPTDGRVTEVCLTEKGDRIRREALVEAQGLYAALFSDTDPAQIQAMIGALTELHAKLRKL